jgi:hypothetical protein
VREFAAMSGALRCGGDAGALLGVPPFADEPRFAAAAARARRRAVAVLIASRGRGASPWGSRGSRGLSTVAVPVSALNRTGFADFRTGSVPVPVRLRTGFVVDRYGCRTGGDSSRYRMIWRWPGTVPTGRSQPMATSALMAAAAVSFDRIPV